MKKLGQISFHEFKVQWYSLVFWLVMIVLWLFFLNEVLPVVDACARTAIAISEQTSDIAPSGADLLENHQGPGTFTPVNRCEVDSQQRLSHYAAWHFADRMGLITVLLTGFLTAFAWRQNHANRRPAATAWHIVPGKYLGLLLAWTTLILPLAVLGMVRTYRLADQWHLPYAWSDFMAPFLLWIGVSVLYATALVMALVLLLRSAAGASFLFFFYWVYNVVGIDMFRRAGTGKLLTYWFFRFDQAMVPGAYEWLQSRWPEIGWNRLLYTGLSLILLVGATGIWCRLGKREGGMQTAVFTFPSWLRWPATLRARLTLVMIGLLFAYSLLLIFSLRTSVDARTATLFLPEAAVRSDSVLADISGELRRESLLEMALLSLVGGIGAYWLAGYTLRSLRHVVRTARQINAGTLDVRLDLERPDDEVKELARALNSMLNRLENAFVQRGRFVADAAHELRTPLATLRTTLETMPPPSEATVVDYQEMAQTFTRTLPRLEKLVSNLLLLATEERPPVDEVVLGPLLEDVIAGLQPLAAEKGVTLHQSGDAGIVFPGETTMLRLVFANLIENSIRYNRQNGRVTVTTGHNDRGVFVTVADTGMGIATAEQPHIFERFYRTPRARARYREGNGLGLSLVAHIVQQYGGSIQVESTPGTSTLFIIQFPRTG